MFPIECFALLLLVAFAFGTFAPMNLLLLEPNDFISDTTALLAGRRFEHLKQTNQLRPNKALCTGLLNGKIGVGQLTEIGTHQAQVSVQLHDAPPPPAPLSLILALPRPKYLGRVLQTVTTLGVKQIHLVNSFRVEKSFWQSQELTPLAVRENLILGLEQCRDTLLPEVHLYPRFKPFVEDVVPLLVESRIAFVAHPSTRAPGATPTRQRLDSEQPGLLAIGPEGGWIQYEVDHFHSAGFKTLAWGERTLKIETALVALISRLLP